jgi:hypothetical protein
MQFTKHLLLVSFLLLQSASALAANWVQVAESDDAQCFIETESIRRIGDKVQCWESRNYDEPRTLGEHTYSSDLVFKEFDCYNRTCKLLFIIHYSEKDRRGSSVFYATYSSSDIPSRIVPESVGEVMMKFLCQQSKKK